MRDLNLVELANELDFAEFCVEDAREIEFACIHDERWSELPEAQRMLEACEEYVHELEMQISELQVQLDSRSVA